VKNPTLSQIEPYRDVVLFNLIFQSMIWLNGNIHLQNIDQIKWPFMLSSKFCISLFSFNLISFSSDLNSLLDLEWAEYMASAVLLVLQEHTVFLANSNYLQGWSHLPDTFHPLNVSLFCCFLGFLFNVRLQSPQPEHDNEHSRMQMKRFEACWWLVLNLTSVSKEQLQNWLKPFCARWFQRISFVCISREASKVYFQKIFGKR